MIHNNNKTSCEVAMEIILWLGVINHMVLKGRSIRKVENHCLKTRPLIEPGPRLATQLSSYRLPTPHLGLQPGMCVLGFELRSTNKKASVLTHSTISMARDLLVNPFIHLLLPC